MIFAARKLQGIGLIILLTFCALIVYPLSLRVSATRAELQKVEREIVRTRQRNRMLSGDIAVLANPAQLERWNTEYLGYAAPRAEQYLPGERALASLDRLRPMQGVEPAARSLMAMGGEARAERAAAAASARRVALLDDGPGSTPARASLALSASEELTAQ